MSAYQPGSDDEDDPKFIEAIMQMKRNPELLKWFDEKQRFDKEYSQAIQNFRAPEELKQSLISQYENNNTSKIKSRIKTSWIWAAAACLMILLGLMSFNSYVIYREYKVENISDFRNAMAYLASGYCSLDFFNDDALLIENWLHAAGAPVPEALPDTFNTLNTVGCKKIKWNGKIATLLCFHTSDNKIVYLIQLPKQHLPSSMLAEFRKPQKYYDLQTIGWYTDQFAYLLVGESSEIKVTQYII